MNPSPQDILKESHTQWLNNPVTQQLLIILRDREQLYKDNLLKSVLLSTDEKYQDKVRANLSSIQTIMKMISDTPTFVELSTNKQPELS